MFEGRLTKPEGTPGTAEDAEDLNDQGLRADTPAFVPGMQPPAGSSSSSNTRSTKDHETKGKSKPKNIPAPRPAKVTTK